VAAAKILVVDDSREIRDLLANTILRSAGYDALEAADGREGYRLAQEQRPQLIIADLQMPGLTGLQLKRALVAAGNHVPLILVTAEGSEDIASQATLAGVAYYLTKPVDVAVILYAVAQALAVEEMKRERAEAVAGLEKRVRQMETIQKMIRELTSSLEMRQVLNRVLAAAMELMSADGGRLFLLDPRGGQLTLNATRSLAGTGTLLPSEPANDSLAAQVARTNQPVLYPPPAHRALPPGAPPYPVLYVPLRQAEALLGVLAVDNRQSRRTFLEADVVPLTTLAAYAGIAVINARLYAEVEQASYTDPLTGLHNRRHFTALAEQEYLRARRFNRPLSAIMIDIDHFKDVNDIHGHAAGDQVIAEVGRRLRSGTRAIDIAGRYGGEEFVLVLPETALPGAALLANRLCRGMAASPITTVAGALSITISLGVATTDPTLPDIGTLLANADAALYEAKRAGRNRVAAFGIPVK
jgi:diguanylate cyclase (GGDEF)-like protein